jgi:predicted transglutaminase-like protease
MGIWFNKTSHIIIKLLTLLLLIFASGTNIYGIKTTGQFSIPQEKIPLGQPQTAQSAEDLLDYSKKIIINKVEKGSVAINYNLADKGVIGFTADIVSGSKLKLRVSKSENDIYYNIQPEKMAKIPMQMGNGQYNLELYQNTISTSYVRLFCDDVMIEAEDANAVFLLSNQIVNFDNADQIKNVARTLERKGMDRTLKIQAIYDYVIENIKYDSQKINTIDSGYLPDINSVLEQKKGICYDYAAVTAALLRQAGIPAKLVKGYRKNNSVYHAWNEVFLDGRWNVMDTTFDAFAIQNGWSFTMWKEPMLYNKEKEF